MLILVAVSVAIVINSGLIEKTRQAGEATRTAYVNESHYGEKFTIGETEYNTIDEYIAVLNGGGNNTLTFTWTGLWGDEEPVEFEFTPGMKWTEWINSDFNTMGVSSFTGFSVDGLGCVYCKGWMICARDENGEWVGSTIYRG